MTDKHTPTPWEVSTAVCGFHSTEVTCIYHYPNSFTTVEVVEPGCRCGEQALTKEDARHIVKCVNSHDRLVEMLTALLANPKDGITRHMARALLDQLDTKKESE